MPRLIALAFNKSIEQEWIRKALAGYSPPSKPLTDEQQAILALVREWASLPLPRPPLRLFIRARAGSGKTFLLFEILAALNLWPVAERINSRQGLYLTSREIKTCHALSFAAWKDKGFNVQVFQGKDRKIAKDLGFFKAERAAPGEPQEPPIGHAALSLVAKAKVFGIVPDDRGSPLMEDTDRSWLDLAERFAIPFSAPILSAARQILTRSIEVGKKPVDKTIPARAGKRAFTLRNSVEIDFADMIYLPVCFSAPFATYDTIITDETQDFSPLRLELLSRICGKNSSLISAGDDRQAIYAFTGADSHAIDKAISRFSMQEKPLTVSFRCSAAVIASAQQEVPDIRALPSAPAGQELWPENLPITSPAFPKAILCRNNAPLVSLAIFALINRRPVAILGRGDIMQELETLFTEIVGGSDPSLSTFGLLLRAHCERIAAKQKHLSKTLADKASALQAIADAIAAERPGASASAIPAFLSSLYPDEDSIHSLPPSTIIFSTIHKSKGLEWPSVGIFLPELIGAYAKQDWEHEAEANLLYVGKTRAMTSLSWLGKDSILGYSPSAIPSVLSVSAQDDDEDDNPSPPSIHQENASTHKPTEPDYSNLLF